MAIEIEFRDGIHAVPDHVYYLLRGIDCTTMTKEQAIRASETQALKDHLNSAQRRLIGAHFREHGR